MSIQAINPATEELLKEYDELTEQDINDKIGIATKRFAEYRYTSFSDRARWMRRAAELLRERKAKYAELMTLEMGKPIAAAEAEAEKCAWVCDYYADHAEQFLADETIETDASNSYVAFQPLGPILAIMPWNFPFWQCFRFAAPGLMAGNVGLLKHASNVPGSALAIEEVFRDAGFPEGCFQTLLIGSDKVGKVIDDFRIRGVTLTGSEQAGRKVGERSGTELKKLVLELGGSDPFVILPSADMDEAVETAVTARTLNNGQSCIAAKRFIVHADIADEFEQRFVEQFRNLKTGNPMDRNVQLGPLARKEFVDDLHKQVEESVQRGAVAAIGGRRPERTGYFYEPTILTNVQHGMPAYSDETFGPVASVIRVQNIDEAITVANATTFGLGASAWTSDQHELERFTNELEAGSVFINGMVKSDPRLPFGGIKNSGMGRELSAFGIREFVNIKTVWVK